MDYRKLIEELKKYTYWLGRDEPCSHDIHPVICDEAAAAIEALLAERDAAVEDLKKFADAGEACHLCKHLPCHPENDHCIGFEWRGPEKGDEQ